MNQQGRVAVLGLGNMGSALARALLDRGHNVIVWNRTSERAEPLVMKGATLAKSPAAAVAASQLVIMCVLDYKAADAILASPGVEEALSKKTFVQLSTGVPEQVCDQNAWVQSQGGHFIAGGILAFPIAIGRPNTVIVYAGDAQSFEQHRTTLSSLGGSLQYLGADPRAATGAYFTLGTYIIGIQGLFFETAALARHFGLSMNAYYLLARLVTDHTLDAIRDGAHRVLTGQFNDSQASIDLSLAYMQDVVKTFEQTGIPAIMTTALSEQLRLGSMRGDGDLDVARITETLWAHRKEDSRFSHTDA